MGGDLNCRSSVWDPNYRYHRTDTIALMDVCADMGLDWAEPTNHGPTHISYNRDLADTVIDLVFLEMAEVLHQPPMLVHSMQGRSDHIPISSVVVIVPGAAGVPRMKIKAGSEEEEEFLANIIRCTQGVQSSELHSAGDVEARAQAMAEAIAKAWDDHATEAVIT
jgi:hypothetical protein